MQGQHPQTDREQGQARGSSLPVRLGLTVTDERQIGRGRPGDAVELVSFRTTFLTMPRAAGARRMGERARQAHPGAQLGLYAWHYLTHASDDPLPGRGTRTIDTTGQLVGHFREGPVAEQAWEATRVGLEAIGGGHVVFRTPAGFTPGALSRRRLEAFVTRTRSQIAQSAPSREFSFVWEPEGMWTTEELRMLASDLDLVVVLPVFETAGRVADYAFEGSKHVWLRVGGMGARPELSSAAAEILAFEVVDPDADPAQLEALPTLVFEGERAHANLRRFIKVMRS